MKGVKLISLSDAWWKLQEKEEGFCLQRSYNKVVNFLDKELKPWQFIPWDKENNCPLERPLMKNYEMGNGDFTRAQEQYQKAKSEVVFEGFIHVNTNEYNTLVRNGNYELTIAPKEIKSISDLSDKGIVLTPEGKKLSGL